MQRNWNSSSSGSLVNCSNILWRSSEVERYYAIVWAVWGGLGRKGEKNRRRIKVFVVKGGVSPSVGL